MQRYERQTTRIVSDHCQSEDLLSFSSISQHEASAFDVQLEATAIVFRRFSIEQHAEFFRFIIIDDDDNEHWKINDILNFRRYQDWIQYKIKWKDLDKDDEWYYVNKDEFDDFEKVLNEFHTLYSRKSR